MDSIFPKGSRQFYGRKYVKNNFLLLSLLLAGRLHGAPLPVTAGGYTTAAITVNGTVLEWGEWGGPLPGVVSDLNHVTALAGGLHHVLALRDDGTVWAWGDSSHGQLGDGRGFSNDHPVQVRGLTGAIAIAAGAYHSYALKNDGTIWGWGDNRNGQLGDGTTLDRLTPVLVQGFLGISAIAAGTSHLIALRKDGIVCSWGLVSETDPPPPPSSGIPQPICFSAFTDVASVAAGGNGSYVLKQDGTVWGWGGTSCGAPGTLEEIKNRQPLMDRGTAIAAGTNHLLILRDDGTVWACGRGEAGQLGSGGTDSQAQPVQVAGGLFNIQAIAAGFQHSAARTDDGTTWTWGDNSQGQLGTGDKTTHSTPTLVFDGTGLLRH